MQPHELKPNAVRVIMAEPIGQSFRVIAEGVASGNMFKSVQAPTGPPGKNCRPQLGGFAE